METQFIPLTKKIKLQISLETGNKEAIMICIDEIQRLESIVRDYELIIQLAKSKSDSTTFKKAYEQIEKIDGL